MSVIQTHQNLMKSINNSSSESFSEEILERNKEKIGKAEKIFEELDDIYVQREKYDLHWAFGNASSILNSELDKMKSEENITAPTYYEFQMQEFSKVVKKDVGRASNQYEIFSRLTLGLDIVISVLLILGVTLIAQSIERTLHSFILVTGFIGLIALVKVSLDRFFIIPRIDEWGWNRYHQLTHSIERKTSEMIAYKLALQSSIENEKTRRQTEWDIPYEPVLSERTLPQAPVITVNRPNIENNLIKRR